MDILEAKASNLGYGYVGQKLMGVRDCYICAAPYSFSALRFCPACFARLEKNSFGPRLGYDEDRPTEFQHPGDTNSTMVLTAFEMEPEDFDGAQIVHMAPPSPGGPGTVTLPPGTVIVP